MAVVSNIAHDRFPKQGSWLGKRVNVCFNYNTEHVLEGTIVRDDAEDPFKTIIRLDNGTFVLSTECQYEVKR